VAYLLVLWLEPAPSIALGMMLVAACPGGNISNFLTHFARGNTALSITISAFSTASARCYSRPSTSPSGAACIPGTAKILHAVSLSPMEVLLAIVFLLGIPAASGMAVAKHFPNFAERAHKPFKILSLVVFGLFIVGALAANWRTSSTTSAASCWWCSS
jgi:BASS family bile acid:Na+ symporter